MTSDTLLVVSELEKWFPGPRSAADRVRRRPSEYVAALDHVSFEVRAGETLGVVGESGCGKSTLARCLVRLYVPDGGRIEFDGTDVAHAGSREVRTLRRRVQMVFQDPYSSLNPRLTVESAVLEAGRVHGRVRSGDETKFVSDLLATVGLPASATKVRPRELSGGQRQRVAIARALAVGPEMLIADEAVSGLDVSIQAQILALLEDLKRELTLTMIFISHQLSVIAQVADRVAVMYLGRIVECGPVSEVFMEPQHPYTKALLEADPVADPTMRRTEAAVLGDASSSLQMPAGCRFRTRCPYAQNVCAEIDPTLEPVADGHVAACHVRPYRRSGEHDATAAPSDV